MMILEFSVWIILERGFAGRILKIKDLYCLIDFVCNVWSANLDTELMGAAAN